MEVGIIKKIISVEVKLAKKIIVRLLREYNKRADSRDFGCQGVSRIIIERNEIGLLILKRLLREEYNRVS